MTAFAHQNTTTTLVFASHNLGQVKRLASRVIYLEQGRLLADLPVHDFFSNTLLQTRKPIFLSKEKVYEVELKFSIIKVTSAYPICV